jgi:hypothetical protein
VDHGVGGATRGIPAVVRALVASGSARTQAALGNARGFHFAADEARALLDTPGTMEARPPYLAWFGPATLEGQLAQGALTLARITSRDCCALLDSADTVLDRTATDAASTPRKGVYHAAQLSRAHVAAGHLDRAVLAGHAALRRLATVRSRCCALALLRPASIRSLQDQLRAVRAA